MSSVRAAALAVVAMLAGQGLSMAGAAGLNLALAAPAAAQADPVEALARDIEQAAVAASGEAAAQGLPPAQARARIASAIEAVIAGSGADADTVLAALRRALRDLRAQGQASGPVTAALSGVSRAVARSADAPGAPGGRPPIGPPPSAGGGGGGGSDYRPPGD